MYDKTSCILCHTLLLCLRLSYASHHLIDQFPVDLIHHISVHLTGFQHLEPSMEVCKVCKEFLSLAGKK